jgi:hypothetical protein
VRVKDEVDNQETTDTPQAERSEALQTPDQIALLSLIVAILALLVALLAIYKGNRNASVATLVTLYEASRQAFGRFLAAKTEDAKRYELCELMNFLEIAAAILNERSFAGVSKEIQKEYLNEVLECSNCSLATNTHARQLTRC